MFGTLKHLALAAVVGIGIAVAASEATADQKLTCQMAGTWVEDKDNFAFVADYIAKNGPDTFSGVYVNSSAGAVANVTGAASNGTWVINLRYTDAKHAGYEKHLLGTGTRGANNQLVVKGTFEAKKNGVSVQKGNFTLNGNCK